jgi:4,5-DOPA dioxygenase extradiol
MTLNHLRNITSQFEHTDVMPVLFLGHGSPMNAIEDNMFVASFRELGRSLPKPQLILCVSAHWETKGTWVTAMSSPETIHDFGGFPRPLYEVQYPAPGSPEWAKKTKEMITKTVVGLDYNWGLDHGAWSVIKHLYPQADVPVIQMSIDYTQSAQHHYDLAKEIRELRRKGVLIVGSGNMVHNLSMVDFRRLGGDPYGYDWAIEANELMKSYMLDEDHQSLIQYRKQGPAFELAIPTPEHYLPLIYTMGLKEKTDSISFFNDEPVGGSLTMTSVIVNAG